jgi:cullin-associated NEDD8-dissociated protein 1
LKQHDIDQEIKNTAIEAMGVVLSVFGDYVGKEREGETLGLLLERTKNESSRLHALKALERCARSPAKLSEFKSVSPAIAEELAALLRQQSREIRQNALSTYIAMVDIAGFFPTKANLDAVAGEMGNLVADSKDSHLAHLALTFCALAISKLGTPGRLAVKEKVVNQIIQVASSSASLLTGQAYHSLMGLFQAMSSNGADAGLGFNDLYPRLFPAQNDGFWLGLHKPAMNIIAEACAVLLCACPDAAKRDQTITSLVAICASPDPGNKAYQAKRHVALLLLGEVGRRASLAMVKQPSSVDVVLQNAFDDEDEAVKVSAASSLGKLVVGDPKAFLPVVMKALEGRESKKHYLVLVSLRELVSSENASSHVAEWLSVVVKVLKDHCNEPNEEVRNMVAECFGKLAVLFPQVVIPELVSAESDTADVKWTKISGMRYAIIALTSCNPSVVDFAKQHIAGSFRQAVSHHLTDRDNLEVCKAALMAVHALVHHTADLAVGIFPHGEGLIDILYVSTEVREELQKKVDFGPFKITVDDGLPLR